MSNRPMDSVPSRGLTVTDFTKIADNGFGDALNSYAHTMVWFREHLYVGTTRANLCMVKANDPPKLRFWPTRCPDDAYDLDLRAQIWRYEPRTRNWKQVFVSPLVVGNDGRKVPRDLGYRGMAVFQGIHDRAPALYVSTWASSRSGRSPLIMRSSDGSRFVPVSELRNDATLNSYRVLLPYSGCLYTSPTGRVRGKQNLSDFPIVFEKSDPTLGDWRAVSASGFGDSRNVTVFEMATFNGFLYAATLNPARGFQIWKTRPAGELPYKWTKVITDGAYRGNLNELVLSMCAFNNALYVGTGIQNGGYDRSHKVGPGATEIIRIHPDDSWDLIVGEPRRTPQGFKFPLCHKQHLELSHVSAE